MRLQYIIFCILALSCKTQERSINSKTGYFEGIVEYELNYEPNDDRFNELRLKETMGSRIEMLFKNGNYLKKYYSPKGSLLDKIYLNLDENRSYHWPSENDTIYWVNINRNDSKTTFRQIKDSLIINEPTTGLETNTIVTGPGFNNKSFTVKGEIYFSKNLKIDPLWYTDYLEGNFNEQIKIGKGIQLLFISEGSYWTQRTTAKSFEFKKIRNEEILFKPPSNAILKEL